MITVHTTSRANKPESTQIEYRPPVLTIRKGTVVEDYSVSEFPTGWDGRAFRLAKDENETAYNVFLARNSQDNLCDCIGFESRGCCKHVDSLRHLLHQGLLDDPREGFPSEPHPSPEQLAAEAGCELPF
jgi:hypothetical protein